MHICIITLEYCPIRYCFLVNLDFKLETRKTRFIMGESSRLLPNVLQNYQRETTESRDINYGMVGETVLRGNDKKHRHKREKPGLRDPYEVCKWF